MKTTINTMGIGVLLIIVGIAILAVEGFSYTKREKIAQIGDLQVTANTRKTVYLSPVLGGISLIAGIAFVLVGRRNP